MPQKRRECFRLLFNHLAWIKHQFLSGIRDSRKSVRDDEMCRWSKEVRTPELLGQIKNFMDKDHRVSIETISAQFYLSVGTVHTIIRKELKMQKICAKFVPRVLREDQKERRCHDSREIVELINSEDAVLQAEQSHPQTFNDSFFWQHWHDLHALGYHWTVSQQGILYWGFKGVQEEIPPEEASTLQIGSVVFPAGQCTSQQLHRCHRLFDQDGSQDSSSASL